MVLDGDQVEKLLLRTANLETQVDQLGVKVTNLSQATTGGGDSSSNNMAASASGSNLDIDKLKYHLNMLKREASKEEAKITTYMKNISEILSSYFALTIEKAFPDLPSIPVPVLPSAKANFGDYQCNVALPIAKTLKKNPNVVAQEVVKAFPENTGIVSRLEVAGPGFINIHISESFFQEEIQKVFTHGVHHAPLQFQHKVIVDFSSPNVAKEMHVGHLRSTIIGDSICRLLEYLGHDVVRLNHVGDWGTQFGMLIAHLRDKFPNFLEKEANQLALAIGDLQAFYKESKKRFDDDPEFKKRAYTAVVDLQAKKPEYIKAWNIICEASRQEFTKIYERLGVSLMERGESFYQCRMEGLVKELENRGFLEEDEGRKIMWAPDCTIPLTIIKSDGGYTYDTSDMACIKQRIEEEQATWIIYVTDAGQATHFHSIFKCAARAGILDSSRVRVDHVGFGVVLGDDKKKFKTRSGDTVRLAELLDEGIKRAGDKLLDKGREKEMTPEEFEDAKTAVAYGCIKYADLSHNLNHEYIFSFDKMLEDKGNTAVYLLYAYTRIRSISRKAGVTVESLKEFLESNPLILTHEKELKLAKKLLRFSEIVDRVANELYLHSLCDYLYEISTVFTEFYDSCYCIERDNSGTIVKVHMNRLILCEVTAAILDKGFHILGITPVSKM